MILKIDFCRLRCEALTSQSIIIRSIMARLTLTRAGKLDNRKKSSETQTSN